MPVPDDTALRSENASLREKLEAVRALVERQFVDIDDVYESSVFDVSRHRLARMVLALLDAQAAKETA